MCLKNVAILICFSFLGCNHGVEYQNDQRTEKIIEKSDSISARVEKSRTILDSITTKTIDEATNKFDSLNKAIGDYKKLGINKPTIKTKIVSRVDTVYYENEVNMNIKSAPSVDLSNDYKEKLNNLIEENKRLKEEIRSIKKESIDSSYIEKSGVTIESVGKNWLGQEIRTKKSKNVKEIIINYSLPKENLKKEGTIYLCIKGPDGIQYGDSNNIIEIEGNEKIFIEKFIVDQKNPNLFFRFEDKQKFKPGNYLIEFYMNGIKINSGFLNLSKTFL